MTTPDDAKNHQIPEEFELSQDKELWELLGQNPTPKAPPLLSRNILREIRLGENALAAPSFWKNLLTPRLLIPGALAALALTAALTWNSSNDAKTIAKESLNEPLPVAVATSLEDSLESELLLAAADTPNLFSDEEVIAMLF